MKQNRVREREREVPCSSIAMAFNCFSFSLAKYLDNHLHSVFTNNGMEQRILKVDEETTIACWCSKTHQNDDESEKSGHIQDEKKNKKKEKPCLVLIQGFATNSVWQWYPQIKPLQKSFRVFVPDLIFFGKSSTKSRHRSEVFQAQMLAKAMESMGIHRYNVAGTSYGGFVAFRMASLFPERVEKVVIANSGVCMGTQDKQELLVRAKVNETAELLLPQSPTAFKSLMSLSIAKLPFAIPSFILNDLIQYFYIDNREERIQLLQGLQIGTEPLPTLTQEALIIWGEHDGIFPLPLAHRLKEHLKKNAELIVVKGTAHCVQTENPNEFNAQLLRFLLG